MRRILVVLFLALWLAGCSNADILRSDQNESRGRGTTERRQDPKPEASLNGLIRKKVQESFDGSVELKITEVIHEDNNAFVKYTFQTNESKKYEGLAYALQLENGWVLGESECFMVHKSIPFTHFSLRAILIDGSKREFRLVSDVI